MVLEAVMLQVNQGMEEEYEEAFRWDMGTGLVSHFFERNTKWLFLTIYEYRTGKDFLCVQIVIKQTIRQPIYLW
ncbi:hypothetical protein [Aquibacillus salsiterrae]|uniref:Uncharacterized protein n=1 Tax=Aquibacillus salsiterrae TaxID=2950439 RepID=A0A9X4AFY0_9BACI|nr:hypothetical protein [Aquibacillus salsiterrae]MDC3418104.1 hypothetical protein [Aquibacillus salsiterrae]